MNGQALRTSVNGSRGWRVRQWPHDTTVAHLIFTDHLNTPSEDAIQAAIEHARRRGARAIRTSALFPRAAEVVLESGFEPIDRLSLLRFGIESRSIELLPRRGRRTYQLRARHRRRAAEIDREAFGPLWGNDSRSLADIRHATTQHRGRFIRAAGEIGGFALSGAAGRNGYLQRLATDPARRREGIARDLVIDSIEWMHKLGLDSAMVNTGTTNHAALTLYGSLGFAPMDEQLTIAELRLSR